MRIPGRQSWTFCQAPWIRDHREIATACDAWSRQSSWILTTAKIKGKACKNPSEPQSQVVRVWIFKRAKPWSKIVHLPCVCTSYVSMIGYTSDCTMIFSVTSGQTHSCKSCLVSVWESTNCFWNFGQNIYIYAFVLSLANKELRRI